MVWILLKLLLVTLRLVGDPRRDLVLENLALRHQLAVCLRARPPQLQDCDRRFWSSLAKSWTGWRDALVLVQPETVVRCAWAEEAVGSIKEPEEVADMVADGIRDERFLILTDPLAQEWMDGKTANVDRWVGGMNKLQRRIEERGR